MITITIIALLASAVILLVGKCLLLKVDNEDLRIQIASLREFYLNKTEEEYFEDMRDDDLLDNLPW